MSYRRFMLLLPLAILASCSTGQRNAPPDVNLSTEEPRAIPVKPTSAPPPRVAIQPAPAPQTNQPRPSRPSSQPLPAETWVPLERWCQANGLSAPRRSATDSGLAYTCTLKNGTVALRIGSKIASWRGVELQLGFAPQMIGGRPFVHSLDIRKNFAPLMEMPSAPINRTIVIDPGHGGTDTGTQNVMSKTSEKEYTLDWARRLQALLAAKGWTVWLTRTNDVKVPLANRVAFAEQHQAGIFVALHFNSAYPGREEAGLETYCLTPKGMPSNLTRGFRDDPSLVFPNNSFDAENLQYAMRVHRAILKVNGRADRGVRRARFLSVLQGQKRPAILIEGGYLSNPTEARRIADPAYRQKLAQAVAEALNFDSGATSDGEQPISAVDHNGAPGSGRPVQPQVTHD